MRRLGVATSVLGGLLCACKGDVSESGATAISATGGPLTGGGATDTDAGAGTDAGTGGPATGGGMTEGSATADSGEEPTTGAELVWSFDHVFGRANLDDDDDNGKLDWYDAAFDGDNELATLMLPGELLDALPAGSRIRLELSGAGEQLRAWHKGQVILGSGQGAPTLAVELELVGGDIELVFEFADHGVRDQLTLTWLDDQGAEVDVFTADVRASPLVINHHLQPTEHVWVVDVDDGPGYNNQAMVQALEDVLGARLTRVLAQSYQWDVWIQDEFEWAIARRADGERLAVVIDSIRDRGLDPLPEDTLVGPDYIAQTWGSPADKTTYDSFGNLDASPPVTVNGTFYPFGRVYYGKRGDEGLDAALEDYLAAQQIQAPFALDTTWLCVGHIDEISGIMPDPAAPRGFRLLFSDVPAMYALLDALPPGNPLPRYAQDYGYADIGELTGDAGLRAYNEDLQADHLDPILAVFKAELGLDDADVILVTTLFEQLGCGSLALIPGTVNFALVNLEGDEVRAFVPDPFLRSGGDQSTDPLIVDFKARAPAGVELHFVDNWDVYHVNYGEVHCGTNIQRAPIADWWH